MKQATNIEFAVAAAVGSFSLKTVTDHQDYHGKFYVTLKNKFLNT